MKADGGAAFPRAPFEVNDYCGDGSPGMSLRDYFIAHAPDEPKWSFSVHMPNPRPEPHYVASGPYGEKCINEAEIAEWDMEQKRQRYIQWPGVWADAILAERERGE